MTEKTTAQENNEMQEDYVIATHYLLTPSIGRKQIINGKTYYVRRFFTGDKNFAETITQLAVRQAYKK